MMRGYQSMQGQPMQEEDNEAVNIEDDAAGMRPGTSYQNANQR